MPKRIIRPPRILRDKKTGKKYVKNGNVRIMLPSNYKQRMNNIIKIVNLIGTDRIRARKTTNKKMMR
jgi:hypothetical protein